MQFAGHPTLGTAYVVQSLRGLQREIKLELNVGVIPVTAKQAEYELQAKAPTSRAPRASQAELAKALGLQASDVGAQPLWVNTGSEQLIVPLTTADAVRRVSISYDALLQVTADGPRPQAYVFADTGSDTLLSRSFTKRFILEDPPPAALPPTLAVGISQHLSLHSQDYFAGEQWVGFNTAIACRLRSQHLCGG